MNELTLVIEMNEAQRTPEQHQAVIMHERIVYDKQMVEAGLANLCRDLKEMRDGKHYTVLGFGDFGDYTEQAHGIGARQAYKYIRIYEKLGVEILNSSSKLGVTKLLEIASLDKDEREELLSEYSTEELAAMNTDEVKHLTDKVRKLEEQLSFFENMPKEQLREKAVQADTAREDEIRVEIENRMRSEYDEEIKKYRLNADKEARDKASEEMKRLKDDLKALKAAAKDNSAALAKADAACKAAEEKAKKAEEAAANSAKLEARVKAIEEEKIAIEKQIRLSADPEFTRFKFLFEAWQNAFAAMAEQLSKLSEDKQSKMKQAIKTVLEGMGL